MPDDTLSILLRVTAQDDAGNTLDDLIRKLRELGGEDATATADVDTDPGQRRLAEFRRSLEEAGMVDVQAAADVDTTSAKESLHVLNVQLEELDAKDVTVDVNVDRDGAAQNALARLLTRSRDAGGGFRGLATNIRTTGTILVGLLVPGLISLAGTLAPMLATAVAAALAVGALGVAAGGAGAAFGALVAGALLRFKAQADIAGTASNALKGALTGLKQAFLAATATGVDRVFSGLSALLRGITPQVAGLHGAFTTLGTAMGRALRDNVPASQALVTSFGQLVTASAPLAGPLVRGMTSLAQIFTNIARAAMPSLVAGARAVADQLARWAKATGDTARMRDFIGGLVTDLKDVARLATEGGRALVGIFNALRGPGSEATRSLTELVTKLANFTNSAKGQAQIRETLQNIFFSIRDLGNFIQTYGPGIVAFFAAFGRSATTLMQILNAVPGSLVAVIGALAGFATFARVFGGSLAFLSALAGPVQLLGRALATVVGLVASLVGFFATLLAPFILIGTAATFLASQFDKLKDAAKGVGPALAGAAGAVGRAAATLGNAIATGIGSAAGKVVTVARTIARNAVTAVTSFAGLAASAGSTLFDRVKGGISSVGGPIVTAARSIAQRAVTAVTSLAGSAINAGRSLFDHVRSGIGSAAGSIGSTAGNIGRRAVDAVRGFAGAAFGVGVSLVQGLASGIRSGASAAIQAAIGVAQSAWEAAKHFLGIGSPSKLFAEVGRNTVRGFAEGLRSEMASVAGSVTGALSLEVAATRGALAPSALQPVIAGGGSPTNVTLHTTIQSLHPSDPETLKKINAVNAKALRAAGIRRSP